jgi:hypothetical protein
LLLLAAATTTTLLAPASAASAKPKAPTAAAAAEPGLASPFKKLSKLSVRIDRSAPGRDGRYEVFATFRNPLKDKEAVTAAGYRLMGPNSQGSFVTARYALYPVAGARNDNQALPVPMWVGPGGEIQVRYVFEETPRGTLTITDGNASQTFTPAD